MNHIYCNRHIIYFATDENNNHRVNIESYNLQQTHQSNTNQKKDQIMFISSSNAQHLRIANQISKYLLHLFINSPSTNRKQREQNICKKFRANEIRAN